MVGLVLVSLLVGVTVSCGPDIASQNSTADPPISIVESVSSSRAPLSTTSTAVSSTNASVSSTSLSTVATTTTAVMPSTNGWPLALAVLDVMIVAPEYGSGYQRDLFPHWTVSNGCSTRDRVLIAESTSFAQVDPFGCRVVAGDWVSPFDGRVWDDPAEIQIDHLVALKEAWASGAWAWTEAQRRAFANDLDDPRSLNAVTSSVNQSKSDLDPADWLPPLGSTRCGYIADWIAVKARWQLSIDRRERDAMARYLRTNCPDQTIAPWETQAVSAPSSTSISRPPTSVQTGSSDISGSVYYANCNEARAAGATPILVGQPGYRPALDRDKDGVACE